MPSWRAGGPEGRPAPKDDWRTPPELYQRLEREFHFALDAACSAANRLAPAGLEVERCDALAEPWPLPGAIWLNPPYSDVKPWLDRAREAGLRVPVVCLIPADTSTRWWWDFVACSASEVRFLRGRVRFHVADGAGIHKTKGGGGSTIGPSAVVVYSPAGGPPRYTYMLSRLPAQASLLEGGDGR
jgi:phage N-6-adenine-methyltransferase